MNSDDLLTASAAIATVVLLLLAVHALPKSLVAPLLPAQRGAILQPRVAAIDGLRAFLALGVVFLHAWAFRETHFLGKPFDLPHYPYFCESGLLAVLVFFMITGFLFWNKAIGARGRVDPIRLYCNRARRILPLYYFLCGCTLLVVLVRAGVRITEPVGIWSREVAGLIVPGLRTTGDLLGTERKVMIAQSWTLYYEDLFYLALPAFGLAARSRRSAAAFVFIILLFLMIRRVEIHRYDYFSLSFLAGISTAELLVIWPRASKLLGSRLLGLSILVLPLVLPLVTRGLTTPLAFVCAAGSFVVIASGNDLLGLLTLRCVRVVGTLSYSIYLLHLIILYSGLTVLNRLVPIGGMGPSEYSMIVCASVFIIAALSTLSYSFIEKPWMRA